MSQNTNTTNPMHEIYQSHSHDYVGDDVHKDKHEKSIGESDEHNPHHHNVHVVINNSNNDKIEFLISKL